MISLKKQLSVFGRRLIPGETTGCGGKEGFAKPLVLNRFASRFQAPPDYRHRSRPLGRVSFVSRKTLLAFADDFGIGLELDKADDVSADSIIYSLRDGRAKICHLTTPRLVGNGNKKTVLFKLYGNDILSQRPFDNPFPRCENDRLNRVSFRVKVL